MWLETYLKKYPYTALIVSHDRDLLNNATTHILALDGGKLSVHTGDYDNYARKRNEARAHAAAFQTRQEAKRRHMQSFVDRFRAKASKAKQAQSRLKALEKLQDAPTLLSESVTPFHFPDAKLMAPPIVRLVEADLGYEPGNPVLKKVNLRLDNDDRIAILGPNGQGKSTLVKAIASRITPLQGNVYKHKKLSIAYFSQHQVDELKLENSAYDHVRAIIPDATEAQTRAATARLGFGPDKADTKVKNLSGGEKARLLLGLITYHGAHLLILDEPTNHLDIEARDALAVALNDFGGAVLLITHDAHLAASVADRLWLVNDGKAKPYSGDLNEYRSLVLNANKTQASRPDLKANTDIKATQRKANASSREALQPLKKFAAQAEARLDHLNAILAKLDQALAEPGLFEQNITRATKLTKERAALTASIEKTEADWLSALEKLEEAANS